MLYNALVLPHLQYCLLVWGDFQEGRNMTIGDSLLRLQKRLAGIIAGKTERHHSDPVLAELGILRIGDLYRQQLRLYAWRFSNGKLPKNQAMLLSRVRDIHGHNTRSAGSGLYLQSQDHRSVGYRVPKEWESVPQTLREVTSLLGFKKKSREELVRSYKAFECVVQDCFICGRNARPS